MQSKKSCFNGALLKRSIRKGLPFWVLYLAALLITFPVMMLFRNEYASLMDFREFLLQGAGTAQTIAFLYAPVVAMVMFSHLYKSTSANFYGALPVTRTAQFVTHYLAGFLMSLVPNLITMVLAVLAGLTKGNLIPEALTFVGAHALAFLFYYSLAVLTAMVVGNLIALPVLYGILNFLAVVVEALVRTLLEMLAFGYEWNGVQRFGFLSPVWNQLNYDVTAVEPLWNEAGEIIGYDFLWWPQLGILAAVGVGFAVLAFLFHRFRRMESAGDVIAVRHLKPVFLYCFTFGCALILGCLFAGMVPRPNVFSITLGIVIGAVIGYFVGEMLLHKSLRIFRKRNLVNCAICCVLVIAATTCVHLDVFGRVSYVPEQEEIQSVSFDQNYYGRTNRELDDPDMIAQIRQLHEDILADQDNLQDLKYEYGSNFYVNYTLKNGKEIRRNYGLPAVAPYNQEGGLLWRYNEMYNDPDYILLRTFGKDYDRNTVLNTRIYDEYGNEVLLNRKESVEFLETILEPDLRESSMERRNMLVSYTAEIMEIPEGGYPDDYMGIHLEVEFDPQPFAYGNDGRPTAYSCSYYFDATRDAHRLLEFAQANDLQARDPRG